MNVMEAMTWSAPKASTTARGYGAKHVKERARWARIVQAGHATCARCHQPIHPNSPWHLDHDDHNRNTYLGPAHARCNIRAGAIKGAKRRHQKAHRASRNW